MSELLEEVGTVVRIEGTTAWVSIERRSACNSCQAQAGCGAGALSALLGRRPMLLPVTNVLPARVGDSVVIGLSVGTLLRGALAVYLLPLMALIACAGAVRSSGFGEAWTVLAAFVGLTAGMWLASYWFRRPASAARYRPQLLRRIQIPFRVESPRI